MDKETTRSMSDRTEAGEEQTQVWVQSCTGTDGRSDLKAIHRRNDCELTLNGKSCTWW